MRRIAALFASLFIAVCATTAPADPPDKATKEILAATDAWRAAYDSRDAARIIAMYGKGAVFWGTTMKAVATSPDSIADYFKDAASRPYAPVVFAEQHVRVYGDVGFNSGAYTFTDKRDGKDVVNPSRYTMVFQRQAEAWVLVHHHSLRVP